MKLLPLILFKPITTFTGLPVLSLVVIDWIVAPNDMSATSKPFWFLRTYLLTSSPFVKLPNDEVFTLIDSSADEAYLID